MAPERDDRLAAIYQRATALRASRTRRLLGAAGVLSLGAVAAVLALGLGRGDGGRTDLAASDVPGSVSTSAPLSTDTAPPTIDPVTLPTVTSEPTSSTVAPPDATPSTSSPASTGPAPSAAVTTTTARACRNSRDPRCGAFRFDPAPANAPTTLRATPSATTVAAGTPVQMGVLATDPDSEIGSFNCTDGVDWSDPAALRGVCTAACPADEPRYGPWDPPPPKRGRYEVTSTHTYSQPGTYQVKVAVATNLCDFGPYRDGANTTVTITVTA